jgi:DNA invertase Pin-like site-specific DNA recombinase
MDRACAGSARYPVISLTNIHCRYSDTSTRRHIFIYWCWLAGRKARNQASRNGRLIFAIFAGLAEFERELIVERTRAGLASAGARGRHGGRPYKMTPAKLRLAQAATGKPETKVSELCAELGITRQTLYRHVTPNGEIRPDGEKLLQRKV